MHPRTPEDCDRLFAERINAGDLEGVVALYEAQATFVPQEGDPVTGPAAIRENLAGFLVMKPKLTMNVTRTVKAGDDVVALYNDWRMAASGPDGTPVTLAGKALEIVRRQPDGTWRFILDDPFARG